MANIVLLGMQWGDEGKGKVTDYLAEKVDVVVRYQGGPNAGHTIVVGEEAFKFHHIPSGILYPGKICVIGNGTVIDPGILVQEIEGLISRGVEVKSLLISDRAHVIMPYHKKMEEVEEQSRGLRKIGTTLRGIGPAYADKIARRGLRMGDFLEREVFMEKLHFMLKEKNDILTKVYGADPLDAEKIAAEYIQYADRLKAYIKDTISFLRNAVREGRRILFEGAQGTMLDIDMGTYPYVTSSNPTIGGVCAGSGVPPVYLGDIIGIVKAYTTRVGSGPFPTEMDGEVAHEVREAGKEYGTTTGRPRRVGWLDAIALKFARQVNQIRFLAVTKLDVLTGLDKIKVCIGYRYGDKIITDFPSSLKVLSGCRPVYEEIPGWTEDISGVRRFADLPVRTRNYLERMEELVGANVGLVSVGPRREQTIIKNL